MTDSFRPAGPLTIQQQRFAALFEIRSWTPDLEAVRRAIGARLGLDLPDVGAAAEGGDGRRALWVGPLRWWVVEEQGAAGANPLQDLAPVHAAVVDLSHARTRFRLAGPAARTALMRLADLDFHPAAFPAGQVAQTLMGHVSVLIHARNDATGFDVYVPRSYGQSLWELLADTGAEIGGEVPART